MNKEIKEINITFPGQILDYVDTKEHLLELFNYITNLQEKVDQYENPDDLTLFYMWLDEKTKDKIKQLQEENKEQKNIIVKQNDSIKGAIEYINKEKYDIETTFKISSKDFLEENITSVVPSFKLLEILKEGSDKE